MTVSRGIRIRQPEPKGRARRRRWLRAVLLCGLLMPAVAAADPGEAKKTKSKPGQSKAKETVKSKAGKGPKLVTFNEHVRPIFESHCVSCHDPDIEAGGLDLSNFDRVVGGGASGEVLAPGDVDGSKLYRQVTGAEQPLMPPEDGRLSKSELKTLAAWIRSGMRRDAKSPPLKKAVSLEPAAKVVKIPVAGAGAVDWPILPVLPVVELHRPGPVPAMAVSPTRDVVAIGSWRHVQLRVGTNLRVMGVLPFEAGQVRVVRFSRGGDRLLVAGGRGAAAGRVELWNVGDGRRIASWPAGRDEVLAADVSPVGHRIAAGGPDKVLRVLKTATGEEAWRSEKHTGWVLAARYSPSGALLASGDRSGGVLVWESDNGREFLDLQGHKGPITALCWRSDGNVLATASEDGTIRLWRTEDGASLRTIKAHGQGVTALAFTVDGALLSAGRDRRVMRWNQNGKGVGRFKGLPGLPLAVDFSAATGVVIAGDAGGELRSWQRKTAALRGRSQSRPQPLEVKALQAQLAKVQSELKKREGVVAALMTRRARAAAALSKTRKSLAAAGKARDKAKAGLARVKEALAAVKSRLAKLSVELEGCRASVGRVRAELKLATAAKPEALAGLMRSPRARLEGLRFRAELLDTARGELDSERSRLQRRRQALAAERQALEKARQSANKSIKPLKGPEAKQAKELAALDKTLGQQRTGLGWLKAALAITLADLDRAPFEPKLAEAVRAARAARETLEEAERRAAGLIALNKACQAEQAAAGAEAKTAAQQLTAVAHRITTVQALEAKAKALPERSRALDAALKETRAEEARLRELVTALAGEALKEAGRGEAGAGGRELAVAAAKAWDAAAAAKANAQRLAKALAAVQSLKTSTAAADKARRELARALERRHRSLQERRTAALARSEERQKRLEEFSRELPKRTEAVAACRRSLDEVEARVKTLRDRLTPLRRAAGLIAAKVGD